MSKTPIQRFLKKAVLLMLALICLSSSYSAMFARAETESGKDFIKWVDFNAGSAIMKKVYELDVKYHNSETDFKFVEVMAYLAVKNGNRFSDKTDQKNLNSLLGLIKEGKTVSQLLGDNKYYKHYYEAYTAIFSGILGNYTVETGGETKYGVRGYFPLARGYWFSHYDDFGSSRSYGFKRKHLGHDLMGSVGTPVIAVEGGTIAELGWNQYGGWRVGIRSFDAKRYYYYAHLRKGHPYPADLEQGATVKSGQVIGFLGNTGYSRKEDVNLKSGKPHLHFGLQLIFDESQVKGSKEIWIDVYGLVNFLSPYRAKVQKNPDTKELFSTDTKIML